MREIKFRAFYQGIMYQVTEILWSTGEAYLYEPSDEEEGSGFLISLQDIELNQFTGLKDKNGKDVFEGDLIRREDDDEATPPERVEYGSGGFAVDTEYLHELHVASWVVIGNIYENPELLANN